MAVPSGEETERQPTAPGFIGTVRVRAGVFAAGATLLRSPETFFAERDRPSLPAATGIVLLTGLVLVLVAVPLLWLLRFVVFRGELLETVGLTLVLLPGFAVGRWLVLTGVVYAAGRLLGGEGRARDLLGYLGWSFLPNALTSVVLLVAMTAAVAAVEPPTARAALATPPPLLNERPLFTLAVAASLVRAETGVSLSQLQFALGLVQFAWNAVIWFAAAKVGLSLSDRRALAAIAIPVAFTAFVAGIQHINVGVSI